MQIYLNLKQIDRKFILRNMSNDLHFGVLNELHVDFTLLVIL